MKVGTSGFFVAEIQGKLRNRGYTVPLSGYMNRATFKALQEVIGISDDEIPDKEINRILFNPEADESEEIARVWLEKARALAPACKYGPGRGAEVDGVFIPSKTWHCNSIVVFMLAWYYNTTPYRKHNNIPPVMDIVTNEGDFMYQNRYKCFGYSDKIKPIAIKPINARAVMLLPPGAYILIESSFTNGQWRWGHHTSMLLNGQRWAADGHRGSEGYSGTPMSLKPFEVRTNKLYQVFKIVVPSEETGKWGG